MHLEWKKWRNKFTGSFLPAVPNLAKQGLKPSGSVGYEMTFSGGKKLLLNYNTFHAILHTKSFPTVQELRQSESVCKSYATQKLTFLFSHL